MVDRRKYQTIRQNWLQILLLSIIIPMVGWLLIQDRSQFKEADERLTKTDKEIAYTIKCAQDAMNNLSIRVNRLETSYEIMIPRLVDNTKKMSEDIKTIRDIVYKQAKKNADIDAAKEKDNEK